MSQPVNHSKEQRSVSGDDRSLGELFSELTRETSTLIRQEVELAKTEMSHKAARIGKDVGFLAAGAAVAYAGFLALVACAIIALAHLVPWWFSALLVGLVVLGIGAFLVWTGLEELKRTSLAPTKTIQTLQEDAQWAKRQTS